MEKTKYLGMLGILALIFLSSCANSIQSSQNNGMMNGGMMGNGNRGSAAKTTLFERGIDGLSLAEKTEISEIQNEQTFQMTAMPVVKSINGNSIRTYAYNGQLPGPLIKVKQGSSIYVNFTNNIDMETTIHWHGLRHDYKFDGVVGISQDAVKPKENFLYKLSFPDAGIFWYHPHVREDLQQELGLYGNIIVEPKDESYFNKADREIALLLDDILMSGNDSVSFDKNRANFAMMGRFGNVMLLNWETEYSIDVNLEENVRFYLTDASNTRPYNFAIRGHKLKLVGVDIGKIANEKIVDSVVISPGERYIIEVLFDKEGTYEIQNKNPYKTYKLGTINVKQSGIQNNESIGKSENTQTKDEVESFKKYFDSKPDYEFELILEGMMQGGVSMGNSEPIEWESSGHNAMMNGMSTSDNFKWIIKDAKTGKENLDINYKVKKGDVKKIRLVNSKDSMHPMQHPMHLHGQRFLVLSVDGKLNDDLGWKDTVLVPSGSNVDILVDFSNPGEWMMHCHISEHLESGMMTMFTVV